MYMQSLHTKILRYGCQNCKAKQKVKSECMHPSVEQVELRPAAADGEAAENKDPQVISQILWSLAPSSTQCHSHPPQRPALWLCECPRWRNSVWTGCWSSRCGVPHVVRSHWFSCRVRPKNGKYWNGINSKTHNRRVQLCKTQMARQINSCRKHNLPCNQVPSCSGGLRWHLGRQTGSFWRVLVLNHVAQLPPPSESTAEYSALGWLHLECVGKEIMQAGTTRNMPGQYKYVTKTSW